MTAPATTYDGVEPALLKHRWYVTSTIASWESAPSAIIEVKCRPDIDFPGPGDGDGDNDHDDDDEMMITTRPQR